MYSRFERFVIPPPFPSIYDLIQVLHIPSQLSVAVVGVWVLIQHPFYTKGLPHSTVHVFVSFIHVFIYMTLCLCSDMHV